MLLHFQNRKMYLGGCGRNVPSIAALRTCMWYGYSLNSIVAVTILLLTTVLLAEKRKLIGLPSGKGEHMLKEDQMLEKDIAIWGIKNTSEMTKLKQWSIWLSLDFGLFSATSVVVQNLGRKSPIWIIIRRNCSISHVRFIVLDAAMLLYWLFYHPLFD